MLYITTCYYTSHLIKQKYNLIKSVYDSTIPLGFYVLAIAFILLILFIIHTYSSIELQVLEKVLIFEFLYFL